MIEASTAEFTAECYELYALPPLGALVRAGDIYAIVGHALTAGIEPGRRPIARGKDEASEADVYRSSPQLAKLLRSEFAVAVVGYKDGDRIIQRLPPYPARIHGFVYLCPAEEVQEFSKSLSFLNILISAVLPLPTEEIIPAALRQMSAAHEESRAFLMAAGKELANLLSADFPRLKNILGRLL